MFARHVNRTRHEHKTSAANRRWALCCYAQRSSLRRTNCRSACLEMEHSGGFWMGSTAATFWIMQVLKSSSVLSCTLLLKWPHHLIQQLLMRVIQFLILSQEINSLVFSLLALHGKIFNVILILILHNNRSGSVTITVAVTLASALFKWPHSSQGAFHYQLVWCHLVNNDSSCFKVSLRLSEVLGYIKFV